LDWITTHDISAEAWRRVLEYANIDFCVKAIEEKHGLASNKHIAANYKKQASQIRVAILQAREYFEATAASSLFTSPNHLYYGLVSLATAVMLLRGTGDKSLDRLRRSPKNRNHGLELSGTPSSANCSKGLSILTESEIQILPNGHFTNWYSTLPESSKDFAIVTTFKHNFHVKDMQQVGTEKHLTTNELMNKKYRLIDLIAHIPDFHRDLRRYGYSVPASRADIELSINELDNNRKEFRWSIHGALTTSHLEQILNLFKSEACLWQAWDCTDYTHSQGCIVTFHVPHGKECNFQLDFQRLAKQQYPTD
jgi:hypothetical protein